MNFYKKNKLYFSKPNLRIWTKLIFALTKPKSMRFLNKYLIFLFDIFIEDELNELGLFFCNYLQSIHSIKKINM